MTICSDMESRRGALFDFLELSNGDTIAIGFTKNDNDDILINRLDSNGCLNSDDYHEVNILTSNELASNPSQFGFFPNPVESRLHFHSEYYFSRGDFEILGIKA